MLSCSSCKNHQGGCINTPPTHRKHPSWGLMCGSRPPAPLQRLEPSLPGKRPGEAAPSWPQVKGPWR